MEIWHVTSHLIAGVLCKASDSDLTLRSPGCYSCSCVCSVPGWVEASGPKREVSSSPAASSASRCPPAASWLAPVACNVQINKLAWSFLWAGHAIFRPMYEPVGMLTWWGSGRHIHLSTAQWRRLRAARWWSGPGAGGPACFCPYKPSSPASTTKTSISGNFRNRIHHHHNGAAKTSPVLRYMQQKWNAFFLQGTRCWNTPSRWGAFCSSSHTCWAAPCSAPASSAARLPAASSHSSPDKNHTLSVTSHF